VISYLVLPKKREHPALLILFSALAIFIFSSGSFFSVADPRRVQCSNDFIQSTMANNSLCLVQGSLSVFGALATVTWLTVLIINLHLHTVWNSHLLSRHYTWIHLFCWGIPFAFTTMAVLRGAIQYEFGENCTINHDNANTLFFYPVFALVVPAFLIHICTFFYIGKISLRARQNEATSRRASMGGVMMAFKIQWRALALAISVALSVILFSVFYFIIINRLRDFATYPNRMSDWGLCMLMGSSQTKCSALAVDLVPTPAQMFAAESVISAMGLIFFLIFAAQRQFMQDWKNLIVAFYRTKRRRQSTKYMHKLEQQEEQERQWEESNWAIQQRARVQKYQQSQADSLIVGSHGMIVLSPEQLGAMYSATGLTQSANGDSQSDEKRSHGEYSYY